jgi:hypothetical protein
VGDNDDLKRIFGLENTTEINREKAKERENREMERKLIANVKRRPTTSIGYRISKIFLENVLFF